MMGATADDSEDEEFKSLGTRFNEAETYRESLENGGLSWSSEAYQDTVAAGLRGYEDCVKIAERVSIFSPNESLEDISTGDLRYLLIHFWLGELRGRVNDGRKSSLEESRRAYERFLRLLDSYDMLSQEDSKTWARYLEDSSNFSTISMTDAAARRDKKIARFREERALQKKLDQLRKSGSSSKRGIRSRQGLALSGNRDIPDETKGDSEGEGKAADNNEKYEGNEDEGDDDVLREMYLTHISLRTHQTFANLEAIAQELHMLSMAPPASGSVSSAQAVSQEDSRLRQRIGDGNGNYSERLDVDMGRQGGLMSRSGPLLAADGRPLRPFTLLDTRSRMRDGVFRPDHNLPTMTIDEYLEEERKRGGIIEKGSGGEASGRKKEVDEDDMDAVDARTMDQRRWDEFAEANPRGSGNTMNMG